MIFVFYQSNEDLTNAEYSVANSNSIFANSNVSGQEINYISTEIACVYMALLGFYEAEWSRCGFQLFSCENSGYEHRTYLTLLVF